MGPLVEQVEVLFAEAGAVRIEGCRRQGAAHGLDRRAGDRSSLEI